MNSSLFTHSLIFLLIEYERAVCWIMINLGILSIHLLTQLAFLKQRSDFFKKIKVTEHLNTAYNWTISLSYVTAQENLVWSFHHDLWSPNKQLTKSSNLDFYTLVATATIRWSAFFQLIVAIVELFLSSILAMLYQEWVFIRRYVFPCEIILNCFN